MFYAAPVHYQDANGDCQPIDNSLVPGSAPGAQRNEGADVELSLPPVLNAGPVQAADDGVSVGFTLQGAQAMPSLGVSDMRPTSCFPHHAVYPTMSDRGSLGLGVPVAFSDVCIRCADEVQGGDCGEYDGYWQPTWSHLPHPLASAMHRVPFFDTILIGSYFLGEECRFQSVPCPWRGT